MTASTIALARAAAQRPRAAFVLRPLPQPAHDASLQSLLTRDELRILAYASFAPSGHNTQPWTVSMIDREHWRIGTDKQRWLPAVDPANRETLLSVGAFLENLIIAARSLGHALDYKVIAHAATDAQLLDVRLSKASVVDYPLARLQARRTVRRGYANDLIKREDLQAITGKSPEFIYFARDTPPARHLAEATIEANRKQAYRDAAQEELANWIRWSKSEQERHRDGLTPAGMEITGIAGWYVSTFYNRVSVLKKSFRDTTIKQITAYAAQGGGWLVMTGPADVAGLIETGRRFERLWLQLRERRLAIHPMTQVLEETPRSEDVARALGIGGIPQFILRIGYVEHYPDPVSPRMPLSSFVRQG